MRTITTVMRDHGGRLPPRPMSQSEIFGNADRHFVAL